MLRLPEELNGIGCYGASVLRILAGSGHSLHWAAGIETGVFAEVILPPSVSRKHLKGGGGSGGHNNSDGSIGSTDKNNNRIGNSVAEFDSVCRCSSSSHADNVAKMVVRMNRYLHPVNVNSGNVLNMN